MGTLKRERAVRIGVSSGTLQVTVNPKPAWLLICAEAAGIVLFAVFVLRSWASMAIWYRVLLAWVTMTACVAWFYQLFGYEVIEFDAQKLVITKEVLGWSRRREYRISDCSDLAWHEASDEGDTEGLSCKVGWRTVRFGEYIPESEAIEIFTALQTNLPEVADQMFGSSAPEKKHFNILDLN